MTLIFRLCLLVGLISASASYAADAPDPAAEIRTMLAAQAEDWSRGDLDGFLVPYDDQAQFMGLTGITKGKASIADNYRKHYGNAPQTMGKLSFTELEVHVVGRNDAWATGRFNLARAPDNGGDAGGLFSLIFHRGKDGWKIVLDHTP